MKPRLTAQRHQEIGAELYEIRNRLLKLGIEVANSYPKNGKFARYMLRMHFAVDTARAWGDAESCREYPDTWETHWYYPGSQTAVSQRY
jgi:hypothetical protein